jgi:hypothetical protein
MIRNLVTSFMTLDHVITSLTEFRFFGRLIPIVMIRRCSTRSIMTGSSTIALVPSVK